MKRAIFFVLLTYVSHFSFSQNLVVNPGFETWEKISKPSGWTTAQNCLKDSVDINSGNYSCRQDGGTKYLGQTISIVPGKQYRLSFFYKTEITGTGNGCRMWCYWKDSDGNNITDASTDDILRPTKYLKSGSFQQFSTEFTSPANASYFYLEVRTYQNSVAWFDDFVFEENMSTYITEKRIPEVKIYPNPANDHIIIFDASDLRHVSIQNLCGNVLWSADFQGEENVTIPVSEMAEGIYIIKILTSDKIIIKKFIRKMK